ncbi:hypothetical protein, partial [Nonomuraea sp. NPDC049028]|uniref:hypothetical protein n=1 Tax=Nonomuraea sp. NPDC049028 TaxID=3364348 RepID=UPI00371D5496
MSSTEREKLHTYLMGRVGLMRGYDRRSKTQDEELKQLEALDRDVLGAERDHLRNLIGGSLSRGDAGLGANGAGTVELDSGYRIESGTSLYGTGDKPSRYSGTPLGRSPYAASHDLRDKALRAVERVEGCADEVKHRAVKVLDSAKGVELNAFSRWVEVSADPDYERA